MRVDDSMDNDVLGNHQHPDYNLSNPRLEPKDESLDRVIADDHQPVLMDQMQVYNDNDHHVGF